jgi:hypothetical protein
MFLTHWTTNVNLNCSSQLTYSKLASLHLGPLCRIQNEVMEEHRARGYFFAQFLKIFDPGWKTQQPIRVGVACSCLMTVVRKRAARAVNRSRFSIQPKHTSHSYDAKHLSTALRAALRHGKRQELTENRQRPPCSNPRIALIPPQPSHGKRYRV